MNITQWMPGTNKIKILGLSTLKTGKKNVFLGKRGMVENSLILVYGSPVQPRKDFSHVRKIASSLVFK